MRTRTPGRLDAPITSMTCRTIDTPTGPFAYVTAGGVLLAAGFTTDTGRLLATLGVTEAATDSSAATDRITDALRRYFRGDLTAIDTIDVAQAGGPFIATAWREMRQVPAGSTVTYRELAARSGRPDAIRAAGAACASNRIALVVPCHRILRTGGALGGYLWGLPVKRWLLAHEGATPEALNLTEGATS